MKKLNNKGFAVTAILYSLLILIILLMFLIIILLSTRRVNLNRAIRDANREIDEREYSYMEICTINPYNIDKEQTKCGYGATGRVRAVKVYKGIYMLEVWGAQGGGLLTSAFNLQGGKGSYATGIITLNADETYMYINVGVRGTGFKSTPGSMEGYATTPGPMAGGGFNFGGMGYVAPGNADLYATGRGGGATDIRINKNNSASRVIVAGGGGIPVKRSKELHLKGTSAVVDKDFASAKLAELIDADMLIILTAIEKVAVNFGKPDEKWLSSMSVSEAERYIDEGHFAPGSMLPKVEAALGFVKSKPGRRALITELTKARDGLAGKTGTYVSAASGG